MSLRFVLQRSVVIAAPVAKVFAFFSDPHNLAKITPTEMKFRIVEAPARLLREGDRIRYQIRVAGFPIGWTTLITEWKEGVRFADLQERGPYRYWLHTHSFREVAEGTRMDDEVVYEVPFGLLGRVAAGWFVRRKLEAIFDYRTGIITRQFGQRAE